MMNVIDLFAGAGGLSSGFVRAGYNIVAAVEFDKQIAETYKFNHPKTKLLVDDIKNIADKRVLANVDANIVIGGPPCQGFSMAGARIRKNFIEDERNYLFRYYYEIIRQILPKGITTMEHGEILNEILSLFQNSHLLRGHKYYTYPYLFKAMNMGIPQKRERFIILGVLDEKIDWNLIYYQTKKAIEEKYPLFFQGTTVWDAISNLANLPDTDEIKVIPQTEYQKFLASTTGITYNNNNSD